MPGARCTRGLVCKMHMEMRTRAYRFSGNTPAFPARGGVLAQKTEINQRGAVGVSSLVSRSAGDKITVQKSCDALDVEPDEDPAHIAGARDNDRRSVGAVDACSHEVINEPTRSLGLLRLPRMPERSQHRRPRRHEPLRRVRHHVFGKWQADRQDQIRRGWRAIHRGLS
jgi:hypothetical protein